ncbi:MAG: hypothetical protein WAP51_01305, partial [Candidatus Sungiibacteriota bacterium]
YGFPLFLVKDEPTLVYGALKMAELKTLLPVFHQEEFKKVLYYPPAPSYFFLLILSPFIGAHYLLSGAPPLSEYKDILALDPSFIWIIARAATVFLGVFNIFVIWLLAKKLFKSERAGLFAALFLALSFYHLQLSHVVRHWLFATVLIYIVWFLAAKIAEGEGGMKDYLFAGTILGVSVGGVNTASVIAAIPLVFAHLFQSGPRSFMEKLMDRRLIFSLFIFLLIAAAFVALYPYGFTRAEGALSPGADVVQRLSGLSQKSISGLAEFLGFYAKLLLRYEAVLFAFALLGGALLLFKRNWRWVLTGVVYFLLYFTLLYLFFNPIPRGLIFVLPLLAVFAGYAANCLWEELQKRILQYIDVLKYSATLFRIAACALFFFALFGWQFATDIRYDWLILQPDTRIAAREWVFKNIPENTKILVDSQYLRFINTKAGIRELERIDHSGLRAADFVLLHTPEERYPRPAHHILNLHFVSEELPETKISDSEFFRKQGFRYFIVEHDYLDGRDLSSQAKALMRGARLIQRFDNLSSAEFETALDVGGEIATISLFDLFRIRRLGKIVEIYGL